MIFCDNIMQVESFLLLVVRKCCLGYYVVERRKKVQYRLTMVSSNSTNIQKNCIGHSTICFDAILVRLFTFKLALIGRIDLE